MRWNTRFCPTITSPELHVGHLYTALVNEREAHRSGGTFSIRVDDNQEYWSDKMGLHNIEYGHKYVEQISMFMPVDKVTWQSDLPRPSELIGAHQLYIYDAIFSNTRKEQMVYTLSADWIQDKEMFMYPCTPKFTFEKVVWDFVDGINWMIRGEDLVTETTFYHFFCEIFGLPWVMQTYLPRLRAEDRRELRSTAPISKKLGNYQLSKQVERFGVDGVIDLLKQSCLIDVKGDFFVENIKWNPTIVGFEP